MPPRKRTHSMSENAWGREHGYTPARAAGSGTWNIDSPRQSTYPMNPYTPQSEIAQVANMSKQNVGSWKYNAAEDSRRQDLGMPFEADSRDSDIGVLVEWDESVVDE